MAPDGGTECESEGSTRECVRKRAILPLFELICLLLVIVGLLLALPINNTAEYWHIERLAGPLSMVDSFGPVVAVVIGGLWYGALWWLVDRGVYSRIRRDRLLLGTTIWSALAYLWLWWLCSQWMGVAEMGERTAVALLGVAAPTINYYLIRGARRDLRRWRDPEHELTRRWLRRRRIVYAGLGGTVLVGALFLYLLVMRPLFPLLHLGPGASPDEERNACHRILRLINSHDAFVRLQRVGDETSVPRLIRSFGWAPGPDEPWVCTWIHCLDALRAITNHDAGGTQAEWRAWYAENKHKSRLEWIADGFKVAGAEVTVEGSPRSVRELLVIIGSREGREYRRRNAMLLLTSYDLEMVSSVVRAVVVDGTPEEKRGAILFATRVEMPDAETLRRRLTPPPSTVE